METNETIDSSVENTEPVETSKGESKESKESKPQTTQQKLKETFEEVLTRELEKDEPEAPKKKSKRESKEAVEEDKPEGSKEAKGKQKEKPVLLPPSDMTKEEKKEWEAASDTLKRYLNRRAHETRSDYTRQTAQLAERQKQLEPLVKAIEPFKALYEAEGIPVENLVKNAIALDQAFKKDKNAAAQMVLRKYGIDASQLDAEYGYDDDNDIPERVDVEALKAEAREEAKRFFEAEQRRQQQGQVVQTMHQVAEQFMKSKPFFGDPETGAQIEREMTPLIPGIMQSNPYASPQEVLEKAYNYVIAGNPQISSYLRQQEEAKTKQAQTERLQKVTQSISGGPGSVSPTPKHKDFASNFLHNLNTL